MILFIVKTTTEKNKLLVHDNLKGRNYKFFNKIIKIT